MDKIIYFKTTSKIIMGIGSISKIIEEISLFNANHIFIVTDKGLILSGIVDKVVNMIKGKVRTVRVFSDVPADPPIDTVYKCLSEAKKGKLDLIIGIGGGSSLDIAKMLSIVYESKQSIDEMFGINLVKKRGIPKILIPTTAGTGSEVTPIAILSDEREFLKKGVVSDYLFPEVAILDGELCRTLPPSPTASSGMDALIHAVEAFTSVNSNSYTDYIAVRAIEIISEHIRTVWANGENIEGRQAMLEGSLLAGQAFANAGVTAVHAFAYPLGGKFHIPHGIANCLMLIPVLRFNIIGNIDKFSKLGKIFYPDKFFDDKRESALAVLNFLEELIIDLRLPKKLREFNITEKDIPELAEGAIKVTRLLQNNARKVTLKDAEQIYAEAL